MRPATWWIVSPSGIAARGYGLYGATIARTVLLGPFASQATQPRPFAPAPTARSKYELPCVSTCVRSRRVALLLVRR